MNLQNHINPTSDIPQLVSLPPEVICRILLHLPLSSRSTLRRCGSIALRKFVASFDRNLLKSSCRNLPPHNPDASVSTSLGHTDEHDNDGSDALRRELINIVEDARWLSRLRGAQEVDQSSLQMHDEKAATPGPCHLRRLTKGDFLADPDNRWNPDNGPYKRKHNFYSDAKLIDDHIWVLYSDYWYSFEAFDLDTGKAIDFHGNGYGGPDKYYFNGEKELMCLLLTAYGGRHGMLAAGMFLSGSKNPHGAWSGPYLTVWDIATNDVLMSIDLYRPLSQIIEVNVISSEKVAVLLDGVDGVELQWHRIPKSRAEMEGNPPPPKPDKPSAEPPPHECPTECYLGCADKRRVAVWRGQKDFWEEHECMRSREECSFMQRSSNNNEEEDKRTGNASHKSCCEYIWWPGQMTLLQSNILRRPFKQCSATMSSDGSGMLVVIVADEVQVWHVGTMTLLRECHPFQEDTVTYDEDISVGNLSIHAVVHPVKDVLGPGEGAYYSSNRNREVPNLERSSRVVGSKNPVDLTRCDAQTILSRFAHLTYDEQRNFEKGECGRGGNGNDIRRDIKMKEGSCSPQLDCIVRVAFSVREGESYERNYIFQLDINPFHHIRHRESLNILWDDEEIEESLQNYEKICLWCNSTTHFGADPESGGQSVTVLSWERGGIFDFCEGGPCDRERDQKLDKVISDNIDDHPQLVKLCRIYWDLQKQILHHRAILSIHIDACKLVISTGYEVSILPFSLNLPGMENSIQEEWDENCSDTHDIYRVDKNTRLWHCFRPLDWTLINRWNRIRQMASFRDSGDFKYLQDPDRPNNIDTITADLNKSLEQEQALMNAVRFDSPRIDCPCISWRYLTVISSPFSNPDGHELLHVFDALADWERERDTLAGPGEEEDWTTEPGLHFNEYQLAEEESSGEESSEDESWENKSEDEFSEKELMEEE
mmetsp:Transcript_15053/g.32644  ORF Transcript_15053/g.32644 Transcript_15053/m.32644 type:complete len:936 (+) Transcript_15053:34-2841(+)